MSELTQTILTLDAESEKALKTADVSALEAMEKADAQALQMLEEEQLLFENKKKNDIAALEEKMGEKRREAMKVLKQKMDTYDNALDVESLTQELLSVVKDRVCR